MIIRQGYDVNTDPRLSGTSDGYKARWTGWLMNCGEAWHALNRGPKMNDPVRTWEFGVGRIVDVKDDGMVTVVRGSNQHESMVRHYGEVMPEARK